MAAFVEIANKRYIGASTDTKPTTAQKGATCLEYDTDALFITYDGTNWVQYDKLVKLVAGTAIMGKVGIDQTTPGTTNGVQVNAGTAVIGKVGHDTTGIANGRQTVTTAGTAVALAASTVCKYVLIAAETDNTGVISVGGSTVVAALATRQGYPLNAGEKIAFPIDNLADVYIDSTVDTDGVSFTYLT